MILTSPFGLFTVVWSIALLLYSLHLSLALSKLSSSMTYYIIFTIIFAFIGSFLLSRVKGKPLFFKNMEYNRTTELKRNKKLYFFTFLFIVISWIEFMHFQSLPFFMAGEKDSEQMYNTYTQYLGLAHFLIGKSSMLAVTLVFFYLYLKRKEKKYLLFCVVVVVFNILLITRSSLISITLQLVLLSAVLGYKIFTMRNTLLGFGMVYLFGFLGHARVGESGQNMYMYKVSSDYMNLLPDGFTMMYFYIIQGLNNINNSLHSYPDATLKPSEQFINYIPKVIRNEFDIERVYYLKRSLVGSTDTYMNNFLSAYGYFGSLISIFLLFVIYQVIYLKSKDSLKWKMILVVVLHNIVLSVFSNSIMDPVFLFEAIYLYIILTSFNLNTRDRRSIA